MSVVSQDNRTDEELPLEEYHDFALFIIEQFGIFENVELSLSYADPDEMRSLNRQYRGVDETTDVLSFPCDGLDGEGDGFLYGEFLHESTPPDDLFLLGDVVIAPAIAREHAEEFDSTFKDEMLLMHVHGILHLLGFDHIADSDYEEMRERETELLMEWEQKSAQRNQRGVL